MTQIISVITKDYVLLASDRRLTIGEGPRRGELFDDDTCKLISLCNICGIGYTGLAFIEGQPTHEWIAKILASKNCFDPATASQIILDEANRAFSKIESSIKHQIFILVGWANFINMPGMRSHFCIITNALDNSGKYIKTPRDVFDKRIRALPDEKEFLWNSIGQPIRQERASNLERNIRKLVRRKIGPKEMLRLLVEEIINTSLIEKNVTVGQKILGLCIPKNSVVSQSRNRNSSLLAKQPDRNSPSFTYFERGFSELQQYGPTFICGDTAMTDLLVESDSARDFQSSQAKILRLPKRSK